jgi:hypothetical protein
MGSSPQVGARGNKKKHTTESVLVQYTQTISVTLTKDIISESTHTEQFVCEFFLLFNFREIYASTLQYAFMA